jgi:hypothetical protein
MWWRKPCEGLHAGMAHLPRGDVREAPTTERSFLAGETESVFEITNWNTRNVTHHGFGEASYMLLIAMVIELC